MWAPCSKSRTFEKRSTRKKEKKVMKPSRRRAVSEDTRVTYSFPSSISNSGTSIKHRHHNRKLVYNKRSLLYCVSAFLFTIVFAFVFMLYDVSSTRMLEARIESTSDVIERSLIDGFRACHVSSDPIVSLNRRVGTSRCDQDENVGIIVFETSYGCSDYVTYSVSFSIKDISCDVITKSRLHACMFNISNVRSVDFEIVAESEMETIFKHKDTIRLPSTEIPKRTNFRSDSFKIGIVGDSQAETTLFRQQLEAMRMHDLNLFVRTCVRALVFEFSIRVRVIVLRIVILRVRNL